MSSGPGHLACPYCGDYDVDRLYLPQPDVDTCHCRDCGARWDEQRSSGRVIARSRRSSVLVPRSPR